MSRAVPSSQREAVSKPGMGATAGLPSSANFDTALLDELAVAPDVSSMLVLKLFGSKLRIVRGTGCAQRDPALATRRGIVVVALALLSLASGCKHCSVTMRMCTSGRIVNEAPPQNNISPVVPNRIPLTGHCEGCRVAVIDVDGLLLNADMVGPLSHGENPVSLFREKLEAAAADPCVRAVVLRINSPGGGAAASDIMRHDLVAYKERSGVPVVACILDVGTGGAYYLATAADTIVAHPTSITGGIGVILNLYGLYDAMGAQSVFPRNIVSGPNIDMGSIILQPTDDEATAEPTEEGAEAIPPPDEALPEGGGDDGDSRASDEARDPAAIGEPLSPEGGTGFTKEKRALLQTMANDFHQRFREAVIAARPLNDAELDTDFDGRVFTATQSQQRGLIDEIGYLDEAIHIAEGMAGLNGAMVVFYHRKNDPARSPYAITPNVPLQGAGILPFSTPGRERTRLPMFLFMWQPEPMLEKLSGR
ncbi:MAG: S49 family peptidase [Pirellulales bacterium]|nr:S49 family peptidase [Pirellulales bacterium]